MGELIGGFIVFVILTLLAIEAFKLLLKAFEFAIVNIISTVLVVFAVVFGFGLLATEASAAMAVAVPASIAVAKMRIATGGF